MLHFFFIGLQLSNTYIELKRRLRSRQIAFPQTKINYMRRNYFGISGEKILRAAIFSI
jgi:hypothetical protein